MTKRLTFLQILIILIGAVLGSFVARLTSNISALSWLAFGDTLGFLPVTLDLGVLSFTVGLTIEVTVAMVIGLIAGIIISLRFVK